jgi:hypothetical protein
MSKPKQPPECPAHGPMKRREGSVQGYTATVWTCPGFDGEGCDYEAPSADWGTTVIEARNA